MEVGGGDQNEDIGMSKYKLLFDNSFNDDMMMTINHMQTGQITENRILAEQQLFDKCSQGKSATNKDKDRIIKVFR